MNRAAAQPRRRDEPQSSASSSSDAIDEQYGAIDAGDARLRARWQVRTSNGPFAISQSNASGAVLQSAFEHDNLTDVAVPEAMARQWAIELALLLAMQAPEVKSEHRASEDYEPRHRCKKARVLGARAAYQSSSAGNDEGVHKLYRHQLGRLYGIWLCAKRMLIKLRKCGER